MSILKFQFGGDNTRVVKKEYFIKTKPKSTKLPTVLPEVTVYGHKDEETENYLNNMSNKDNELFNPTNYSSLWKSNIENGSPKIRLANDRANYRSSMNTMTINNTNKKLIDKNSFEDYINSNKNKSPLKLELLNKAKSKLELNKPSISEYFAELSHAKQYKENPIMYKLRSIYDNIFYKEKDKYDNEGRLEHEAHSIIEPQLKKTYPILGFKKGGIFKYKPANL